MVYKGIGVSPGISFWLKKNSESLCQTKEQFVIQKDISQFWQLVTKPYWKDWSWDNDHHCDRYDPWSCLCTILDLLICKFWIIIVCLEWSQLDHGEWFFLMCCWLCFVSIVLFNAYVHQSICHISLFMFIVSSLPDFDIRIIFAQKHWEWEPWPLFYFVEWLEDCWMWGTPSSSVFSFTRKYFII